jgi:hypothetical protein
MAARRRGSEGSPELSERQRYWLKHLRAAERRREPLKHYAKRQGLSEHSLYEAKRRLRERGVLAPARERRPAAARFVRVVAAQAECAPARRDPSPLRVQLASGAVLDWAEAPAGEALRDLIGWLR